MKIEQRRVDRLVPFARNARQHSPGQIARIAGSVREFGWTNPVLVDGANGIIAGHGRVLAAQMLGMEEIPCIELAHLSDTQKRAYVIADNRLAEAGASWDLELLQLEIDELRLGGFDIDLTGFGEDDLAGLFAGLDESGTEGDTEPRVDRAGELREQWGVEAGQLWACGDHRILCGDSTKADDVAKVMQGENAGLCFTSPPYGQQRDYREGGAVTDWDALMQGVFGNLPMADDGQVLVNLGMIHRNNEWIPYWDGWIGWMRANGWRRFGWYVWDKGSGLPGDWDGRFAPSFEMIFHFNKQAKKPEKWVEKKLENICVNTSKRSLRGKDGVMRPVSNREASLQTHKIPDAVVRIYHVSGSDIDHPAMFPIGLAEFAQRSWPGICYEPFSGSGTTLIACENLGRKCRAVEISPSYVAVALQRWADHTGKSPVLIG